MAKTVTTEMPGTAEELEALLAAREKELAEREKALAAKEKELKKAVSKPKEESGDSKTRKVKVRLPLGADKEPVMVRVNDHTYLIKRGVEVEVPYFVGLHLQECMEADDRVSMRLSGMDAQYSEEASKV